MAQSSLIALAIVLTSASLFPNNYLFAQDQSSQIERLNIAGIHSRISVAGTQLGNTIWGRFVMNKYYPWMSVFENPAFLAGQKEPTITFQFSPRLNYGLTNILGLSEKINGEITDAVANQKSDNLQIGFPRVNLNIIRDMQWPEGMVLMPMGKLSIGLMFYRPITLDIETQLNSVETTISTLVDVGGGENKVILNSYADAINRFQYSVTSTSFMFSLKLNPNIAAGLNIERLQMSVAFNSVWNIQGAMLFNQVEHLFNDEQALWHNDINQNVQGSYDGVTWRFTSGGWFGVSKNFLIDFSLSLTPDAHLSGKVDRKQNRIPALDLDGLKEGGDVEEILDPVKLELTQLTLTEPILRKEVALVTQKLPEYIKLGITMLIGNWRFYLSSRVYLQEYSLQYAQDIVGLNLSNSFNFYLGKSGFYTKLGIFSGESIVPSSQDFVTETISIFGPNLSIGYGKLISNKISFVYAGELLPVPGLNFGIRYML